MKRIIMKKLSDILNETEEVKKAKVNEGWKDDDNKKIVGKPDRDNVACGSEDWEKEPVFSKMKSKDESLTKDQLNKAFAACCKEVPAPHERDAFEACMINKLGL